MSDTILLILQKKFFIEILQGIKKIEYRSFTDFYITIFCNINSENEIESLKDIKKIRFACGYTKNRPEFTIECKGLFIECDDLEKEINTENSEFAIELGEIIETHNCESLSY